MAWLDFFKKKNITEDTKIPRLGEVGLTGASDWSKLVGKNYNPSDVSISTYKEMMKDSQVKAGFSLIKLALLSRNWRVTIESKAKNSDKIIDYAKYILDHINGRVSGALSNILTAVVYGFSVTEIVHNLIREGKFKGKYGLKKLKGLDPEEIEIKADKYGNLESVEQSRPELEEAVIIPKDNVIVYTNEKEFGNWYGTSRLRAIYKNWFIKNAVLKFWNIALERFGQPIAMATVPTENDIDKALKILDNLQAKSSIAHVEGWDIKFMEAMRRDGGKHKEAINYHNQQIMIGLLCPPELLGQQSTGSYAKVQVQYNVFTLMLKNLENDITGIIEEYLIKPLIKVNFGEQEVYPEFRFEPLSIEERLGLARSFALLVKNQIVDPDEEWMRDIMGIPRRRQSSVSEEGVSKGTKETPKGSQQVKTPQPQRGSSQSLMKEIIDIDEIEKLALSEDKESANPQEHDIISSFLDESPHNQKVVEQIYGYFKLGLISKAIKEFIKQDNWEIDQLFNLDKYSNKLTRPVYSKLPTSREENEELLVDGFYCLAKDDNKLAIRVCPLFGCFSIGVYSNNSDKELANDFVDGYEGWAKENNFLKGEKITPMGKFLDIPTIDFNDLKLPEMQKKSIKIGVLEFFKKKEIYKKNKLPFKRGLIFAGEPGTGKTFAGKVLMNNTDSTFIWVTSGDLSGGYYRIDPTRFKMFLDMAKELAPSILFAEDIDDYLEEKSAIDSIKTQMDGLDSMDGVVTILCTNYPKRIPKSLIDRPSRFDEVIEFNLPDEDLRYEILDSHMNNVNIKDRELALRKIAEDSGELTGAHLKEVAIFSILLASDDNREEITIEDLIKSLNKVKNTRNLIKELNEDALANQ